MSAADWPCEAYGPEALEHGARCFLADLDQRVCPNLATCRTVMSWERRQLWQRIQTLAAAGDPVAVDLAAQFHSPDELLGGKD